MFEQAYDEFRKAAESTVQYQQEMFKKWMNVWPGNNPSPFVMNESAQKFQKRWCETVGEMLKKQRESLDQQYEAGLKSLEQAFEIGGAKNPEEFRTAMMELWKKNFECLRGVTETQLKQFQAALEKWTELMTKHAS